MKPPPYENLFFEQSAPLLSHPILLLASFANHAEETLLQKSKRLSGLSSNTQFPILPPSIKKPSIEVPSTSLRVTPSIAAAVTSTTNTTSATSSTPCWVSKTSAKGKEVKTFSTLDKNVKSFLKTYKVPAANLVVRYKGTVVLERGYGYQDLGCKTPMNYDGIFRLASLTKMITASMARNLIATGKLRGEDLVFCVGGNTSCILTIPGLNTPDPRAKNITVQQLLDHKGGWDRDLSGDPVFNVRGIANDLQVPSPPSKLDTIRHHMNRPLDFNPGERFAYSNFGYLVLGVVIEKVTSKTYYAHLKNDILKDLSISSSDIKGGNTLQQMADPREPYYYTPATPGLYPSVLDTGPAMAPLAYATWNIESVGGAGSLIATTRAYSKFLSQYWISGDSKLRVPCGNCSFAFFGSYSGTATLGYQSGPDIDVALFLDYREESNLYNQYWDDLFNAVDTGIKKVSASKWNTTPPSGHAP